MLNAGTWSNVTFERYHQNFCFFQKTKKAKSKDPLMALLLTRELVILFINRYSLPIITKPSNQSEDEEKCQLLTEEESEKHDDQNEFQGPMLPVRYSNFF